MIKKPQIEACVESLKEATLAAHSGAHRLEYCARLDLDGLTPSIQDVSKVIEQVQIPVKIMIRPRSGDFCYSHNDKTEISDSVQSMKSIGVQHYVYGSIRNESLDLADITAVFRQICADHFKPQSFTIHKAIDTTSDVIEEVKKLMSSDLINEAQKINCQLAILSSGGSDTAMRGHKTLKEMIRIAGNAIEIIAAGKITSMNLDQLVELVGAPAYHGRKIVAFS